MPDRVAQDHNDRYLGDVRQALRRHPRTRSRRLVRLGGLLVLGVAYGFVSLTLLQDLPSPWPGDPRWFRIPVWFAGWIVILALARVARRFGPGRRRWQRAREVFLAPDSVAGLELVANEIEVRFPGLPDLDATLVHNRARFHLFFGEVNAARAELDRIDWEQRAPAIQALGLEDEACFALLCTGDVERGLALARRARALADAPGKVARQKLERSGASVLLGLGEVLAGEADAQTLARLRMQARQARDAGSRLLAVRALYVAAARAGDTARAETLRRRLEGEAPHCAPLLADADGPPAGAEWARDPGEPSRALLANAWTAPAGAASRRRVWPRRLKVLLLLVISFVLVYLALGP